MMEANVGKLDRIIRTLIGFALLSLFFFLEGNLRYLGLIGSVPLLTAWMKYCPLYPLFGINTMKKEDR